MMMEYNFQNKVAVVTGGAHGIGQAIAEKFRNYGATVCVIDKAQGGRHFVGDISNSDVLEKFTTKVVAEYGHVGYINRK